MFNPRAAKSGAEAQAARDTALENETVQAPERIGNGIDLDVGLGVGHRHGQAQKTPAGHLTLFAPFAAVATRIDVDRLLEGLARAAIEPLGIGDHTCRGSGIRDLARRTPLHVGPQGLAPGMQRRMRRRALAAQVSPHHPTQRTIAAQVTQLREGDDRKPVTLARQEVTRQKPRAHAAVRAASEPQLEVTRRHRETHTRPL